MTEIIQSLDWTQIIVAVISLVIALIVQYIAKYAVPWLKQNNLYEAAKIAVNAAEAAYGRYHGSEKIAYALNALKEQGWNIESKQVVSAIEAAWQELDIKMIDAAIKEPENTEVSTSEIQKEHLG